MKRSMLEPLCHPLQSETQYVMSLEPHCIAFSEGAGVHVEPHCHALLKIVTNALLKVVRCYEWLWACMTVQTSKTVIVHISTPIMP